MKNNLFFLFLFIPFIGLSQIWKPVKNKIQAEYFVYQTKIEEQAQIIGYKVNSELECTKPGMIFLSPIWYSKGKKIYFVDNINEADIVVFWTSDKEKVKWKIKSSNK
jgi:hypothetical protein